MSAWQPIDTCPKDGSSFRAWVAAGNRKATENEDSFHIGVEFTIGFPVVGVWKEIDNLGVGFVHYPQEELHEVEDVLYWQPLYAEVTTPEGF